MAKKELIHKTRTRRAIIEAFGKLMTTTPFDKITIQNIADMAEVNRHSFYNHFDDKYDLLYQIISQFLEVDISLTDKEAIIQQSIRQTHILLQYFEQNRIFFKSVLNGRENPSFQQFFQKLLIHWVTTLQNICEDRLKILDGITIPKETFYETRTRFLVAGFSQLLIHWLYYEPDKPSDVLADEMIAIYKSTWNK